MRKLTMNWQLSFEAKPVLASQDIGQKIQLFLFATLTTYQDGFYLGFTTASKVIQ